MFYAIVLMMVAAFLALRLYTVLGKRTGHEQPLTRPADERVGPKPLPRAIDAAPEARETASRVIDAEAESGMRGIIAAEPGFDVSQFLEGAQGAYRMVLEAFWRGDRDALRDLVTADVFASFDDAIRTRDEAAHTLENRLVSIERATVIDATLSGREARILVRFDADIAAITRDADGQVIAGSTDDAVVTNDVWTFERTLRSSDPNWKLADTDEA